MSTAPLFDDLPVIAPGVLVAGVDEAGRGPLAGPVSAAAVILDPHRPIDGLADSKALGESEREQLAVLIRERALAAAVVFAEVDEIDRLNILGATLAAMSRAVAALEPAPGVALVDGKFRTDLRKMFKTQYVNDLDSYDEGKVANLTRCWESTYSPELAPRTKMLPSMITSCGRRLSS